MSNAVATMNDEPIERGLVALEGKFSAALPAHIPSGRFVRAALSSLTKPEVRKLAATLEGRKSIYDACLKAASDGLLLDGREAALAPYGNVAQYMPMVAGLMKKARNSGEVASIVAQVVYDNDDFEINYVTDGAPVVHKPDLTDRGRVLGAYAVARLKDGTWTQPEYMSAAQINAIRDRSRAKNNGPWVTDWNEMARKTVIRRASKYWPSSTDKDGVAFDEVVRRDDDVLELEATEIAETVAPKKKRGAAAKILEARHEEETHDAETGEVTSPDV